MSKTQTRGNCQCCGRDQAVAKGTMAHHGYTVDNGYFNGTCGGHMHAPLQVERTVADSIVAKCRQDAERLDKRAAALKDGTEVLTLVKDPNAYLSARPRPPSTE